MRKILMHVKGNIKKTMGHTISLFIMFLIASLLLNIGLLICFNLGDYFNKTTKELKTPNIYYIMPTSLYSKEVNDYLYDNANINSLHKENAYWANAEIKYKSEKRNKAFLFKDMDQVREMGQWKFVGKHLPADSMSIYLPYLFELQGGYHLGDKIKMTFQDHSLTFTIKGFVEDVYFSSPELGLLGAYLPHNTYEKVGAFLGESDKATLIYANLKTVNKDIETGLRKMIKQDNTLFQTDTTKTLFSIDLNLTKMSRTMMASIVSIMIVAFSFIILFVCLIVVRFRINNSIEDDMVKIGSMKAIGYTSAQIRISVILQFAMIAFIGALAGIALSYTTIPALSSVFAQQSGLKWKQGFDASISLTSLSIVLIIVVFVAILSSKRVRKLHPIVALRGGIVTHNFQKNHMPLDRSRGSLPILFALKSILQNKKQSFMIMFILVTASFAQTFAVVMFYNTSVDTKAFLETPGVELSNAIAVLKPDEGQQSIVDKISKMKEVRKVQFLDETMVNIDKSEVSVYVMKDYSNKETITLYKGRYPIHNNEIVLAGHLAEMLGKSIGDNVELKKDDKKATFIVTGLSQGAYMGGMNSSITYDGIMKLNPGFKQQTLNIYLKKGENAATFVKKLDKIYGDNLRYTLDMDENMKQGAGVYVAIVSKVGIAILAITMAVVFLVLYFVINSTVVRKRRELGIQKAIGFTTFQLMNQLSLSFLPPIIIGVCIGCVVGMTQTNSIMTIAQSGMGISKANFIITLGYITLFGVGIIVISYITSILITLRIRKISAYALVTE